jgi:hypothetical protein
MLIRFFRPSGHGAVSERLLGFVLILCTAGWVGGSLYTLGEAVWWGHGTRQAEGVVLSVTRTKKFFGKIEVQYAPNEDASARFVGSGFRWSAEVGDLVPVRFHPNDPSNARIDGLLDRWGAASVLKMMLMALAAMTCYSLLHSVVVAWMKDGLKGRIEA